MISEEFREFCEVLFGKCGPPPKIGTFVPTLGDVGLDEDGVAHIWTGDDWLPAVGKP